MSENEQPQTSDKLLLNLINSENESTIEREQIDFGLPNSLAEPIEGSDANTRTEVIADPDAPWNKSVKVDYHRRDLNRYFGGGVELAVPKGASKEDIISRINAEYDTRLSNLEMEISPAPSADNIPGEFVLKAVPNSLGYIGQVALFLDLTRSPLSDRLTKSDLDGFGYPNANTPSLNNIIFERNALAPDGHFAAIVSSGIADNRKGFNFAKNGEVVAFVRAFNTRGGWDTTGGTGVDPNADGVYPISTATGSHSNFGYARSWQVAFGFQLTAEQNKFQDILEGYDVELEVTTAFPNGSGEKKVTCRVEYLPTDATRLRLVNKDTGVVIGNLSNSGSGKTTYKFRTDSSNQALFPGMRVTNTTVNGTNMSIYRGQIKTKLTLTRKTGRAKVIEIITDAIAS